MINHRLPVSGNRYQSQIAGDTPAMLNLYSYFRSSASYRVRIALQLKALAFNTIPVHLLQDGGQQHSARYLEVNPEGLVPALEEGGHVMTQSLAIIEYLDEVYGGHRLLPEDPLGRARVRSLALQIACEIHPVNNLRILDYLKLSLKLDKPEVQHWYRHWISEGFRTLEIRLQLPETGLCCHGDLPGVADCCLVPQVYNARRFEVDLSPFPNIVRVADHCESLPAFLAAHPDRQPDAP